MPRSGLTLTALILIGGCSAFEPSTPLLPAGAAPMVAPAEYQDWISKTRDCSGLAADFTVLQWYVVPGVETFPTEAGPKVGMWERTGSTARIVIAGKWLHHEMVVRHEMLHHLLNREGHPADFFVARCHLTWESWGGPSVVGGSN